MIKSAKYILVLLLGVTVGKNLNTCKREKELYALVEIDKIEPMEINVNGLPPGYDLIATINLERGRHNVQALDTNSGLFCASQMHINEMVKSKTCAHEIEKEYLLWKRLRLCGWTNGDISEMIACDFDTIEDVIHYWSSNEKSIQTLLDPKWKHIGCERMGKYWVCVLG